MASDLDFPNFKRFPESHFDDEFGLGTDTERRFKMKGIDPENINIKINIKSLEVLITGGQETKTLKNGVTSTNKSSIDYKLQLPCNVDLDTIESSYLNGQLKIFWKLKKYGELKGRVQKIPIKIIKE